MKMKESLTEAQRKTNKKEYMRRYWLKYRAKQREIIPASNGSSEELSIYEKINVLAKKLIDKKFSDALNAVLKN